ncbi:MAG: helix-turn-helix transcriptional regulator [Microbacteriaceae bacterium]|nr:helix-turn-helix transcriptional regulator [Microbacteriaceae bacterium]
MASSKRPQGFQTAFGKALRRRRERLDVSQEALAFTSEIHRTYISELERGLKNPSLTTIDRLAAALKTKASTLIADAEAELG